MSDESVVAAAQQLGLTVGRSGSAHHISPCPACGTAHRHSEGRSGYRPRGAIGVRPDDAGWRCFVCDASGGARWLMWLARDRGVIYVPKAAKPVPMAPYMTAEQAAARWASLPSTRHDLTVRAWMASIRVTPTPATRQGTGDWLGRVVVRMYDEHGESRNFIGRPLERSAWAKSTSVAGYRRGGLVMADALGVQLLRGEYAGPCLVVEGEKKLLISEHLSRGRWATISTGSGLWSQAVADRVALASRVLVYTDPDEAGARYASAVVKTLPSCELRESFSLVGGRVMLHDGEQVPDDDRHVAGECPEYMERLT